MLEACEAQAKRVDPTPERPKSPTGRTSFKRRTSAPLTKQK